MVLQKTPEIPQFVDTVADVPVVWPCRSSVAAVEKTAAIPQLQLVVVVLGLGRSHACCVQRQMPDGSACRKLRCLAVAVFAV